MEIRHLRSFVAVAEERHFGRAAERLHMAQPPLSQQIKQLEAHLGVRLLERTTRRVDLTAAGRLMLDRTRRLLADLSSLEQDVREVGTGAAGVLRVGFVGSATHRHMPRLVQRAREEMPGVRLQISGTMLTPQLEEALLENRLDVALLRPPVRSGDLVLETVEEGDLVLAVPAGHPLADGAAPVPLAELGEEDFVSFPQESALTAIVQEAARQAGFRPRLVQRAGESATVLAFVAAGMGVAVVPEGVQELAPPGAVAFRPIAGMPTVDLAVAHRADVRSPLVPAFLDLLRRTVTDPIPADPAQEDL
ncbi:LysR substrate-binding domain-containing protein [Micrococcus sp.]|uniref:LysR substrate-binding domain-containing protein n=1 Tax=Micrococcus sp. TaxID=1271 RepID=UPI0026DD2BF1|nr:LysR substrate-binding domain-containing protein [Micrococcus sp.]MDO4239787.1 LysR substrate-binding domain-containing protein [Micrococcus sp.]